MSANEGAPKESTPESRNEKLETLYPNSVSQAKPKSPSADNAFIEWYVGEAVRQLELVIEGQIARIDQLETRASAFVAIIFAVVTAVFSLMFKANVINVDIAKSVLSLPAFFLVSSMTRFVSVAYAANRHYKGVIASYTAANRQWTKVEVLNTYYYEVFANYSKNQKALTKKIKNMRVGFILLVGFMISVICYHQIIKYHLDDGWKCVAIVAAVWVVSAALIPSSEEFRERHTKEETSQEKDSVEA